MRKKWVVLFVVLFFGLVVYRIATKRSVPEKLSIPVLPITTAPASRPSRASRAMLAKNQPERERIIRELQKAGEIIEIRCNEHIGTMIVSRSFLKVEMEEKEELTRMVYTWCVGTDPDFELLTLVEDSNGKEVGEYSDAIGGLRMN